MTPLNCPGPSINNSIFQRLNKDTAFLLSVGNNSELYRSVDGGNTWAIRMDTTLFAPGAIGFFNGMEGLIDYGYGNQILRSKNGGSVWTLTTTPFDHVGVFKTYGDSTIIGGGVASNAVGYLLLSKDRGHTWPIQSGIGGQGAGPTDLCFWNSDTIFGVSAMNASGKSYFTKTINGGQNWENSFAPLKYNFGITVRKGDGIFVVGSDDQNNGVIAKSDNLGQSWIQLNTGISCKLHNLIFLNDSIALLSGTNGVLLRWNYKNSILSSVRENEAAIGHITILPNPTNGQLLIETDLAGIKLITLSDVKGTVIRKFQSSERKIRVNVSEYQDGIYFLTVNSEKGTVTTKVIKN